MLIKSDSPLVRLPEGLERQKFKLLNALRLTIQSTDISYGRLFAQLHEYSCGPPTKRSINAAAVLTDAWSVVTSFDQARQLAWRFFDKQASPTLGPFQDEFYAVRSDHAHRMERLTTDGYDRNPDFGVLRWLHMERPGKGVAYALIGGNVAKQTTGNLNPYSLGTPSGPGVQCISLDSFVANARLTEAAWALAEFTKKLEDLLRPQFEGHTTVAADMTLALHFEPEPFGESTPQP